MEVQAWLDTLADGDATTPTIVPSFGVSTSKRAFDALASLRTRGQPVELRTGKLIGEGGMGTVREAEQVALGRTVAIKTLKAGRTDVAAASDLLREAWVTGALEHPNIIPVHHLEVDDAGMPLLILKRIDGVEWSALCRDAGEVQRRFGASDLLAWNLGILVHVLNALRFAHARGVIHRDLKPSNVMIGNFGEVYLLDWGIAVSLREDVTGRFPLATEATDLAGTPAYMAPEMIDGGEALSERTDVYLAGAVIYELLAGHAPHRGANALAILANIAASRPVIPADAPPELAQICERAMQPDPAARFPSIAALQQAITGYLEHRGSARLAQGAARLLDELVADVAARDPAQREEVYRKLAICRFAYHEALAAWRDNPDAKEGISRATIAVAEWELAVGDPRSAVALLSELDHRPSLLAMAQAAADARTARDQKLEELVRDHDPRVQKPTVWLAAGLGFVFTLVPLLGVFMPELVNRSYKAQIGWAGSFFLVFVLAGRLRGFTSMSAINRRIFLSGGFMFASQAVLFIGLSQVRVPIEAQPLMMFLYGVIVGMFALTTDRWLLVSTALYFVAFPLAAANPDYRYHLLSLTNLAFTISIALRWAPLTRAPAPPPA